MFKPTLNVTSLRRKDGRVDARWHSHQTNRINKAYNSAQPENGKGGSKGEGKKSTTCLGMRRRTQLCQKGESTFSPAVDRHWSNVLAHTRAPHFLKRLGKEWTTADYFRNWRRNGGRLSSQSKSCTQHNTTSRKCHQNLVTFKNSFTCMIDLRVSL
jgi:hypothetical protein